MPTVFRQATATSLGTTPVDIIQIPTGIRATVIGCNLANTTEYDTIIVDVKVIDGSSSEVTYVRSLPIPPNTSVKLITNGEKLILPETTGLRIVSDTEASVDAVISYVEIS
jgi:hypothetical protein